MNVDNTGAIYLVNHYSTSPRINDIDICFWRELIARIY